jgi:hypothetical protein
MSTYVTQISKRSTLLGHVKPIAMRIIRLSKMYEKDTKLPAYGSTGSNLNSEHFISAKRFGECYYCLSEQNFHT